MVALIPWFNRKFGWEYIWVITGGDGERKVRRLRRIGTDIFVAGFYGITGLTKVLPQGKLYGASYETDWEPITPWAKKFHKGDAS